LQGTRDSFLFKEDHAYVVFETWKCNDKTKRPGTSCAVETYLKCKTDKVGQCSLTGSVDKKTILKDYPSEINLYEDDLIADSIDNWTRNKIIAMKVVN
jgi:hypothetical protein